MYKTHKDRPPTVDPAYAEQVAADQGYVEHVPAEEPEPVEEAKPKAKAKSSTTAKAGAAKGSGSTRS